MSNDKGKIRGDAVGHVKNNAGQKSIYALAMALGIVSVVTTIIIGVFAYRHTINTAINQYETMYLEKAEMLSREAVLHPDSVDELLLESIKIHWTGSKHRSPDEYICIVDENSKLILHSAHPETVGNNAGRNLIIGDIRCTLSDLVESGKDYSGGYISSAGHKQVVAFVHIPERKWVLGVHRSQEALLQEVNASIATLLVGYIVACVILMPISLLLLSGLFYFAQSKREQMQKKLAENQAYVTSVIDSAPIGICVIKDRVFSNVNRQLCKMTGYTEEDFIGRNTEFLYRSQEEYHQIGQMVYSAIEQEKNTYFEVALVRKDSSLLYALLGCGYIDRDDPEKGITFTLADMTDYKEAQKQIREKEAELKSIFKSAASGITLLVDYKFVEVNDRMCEITGYSREELIGHSPKEFYEDEKQYERDEENVFGKIRKTGISRAELKVTRKDGTTIDLLVNGAAIDPEDIDQGITVTFMDITELKKKEEELREAKEQAEKASRIKTEFLANMSHELRTPLNGIMGFSDILAEENLTEEQHEHVEIIRESSNNLLKIINDILDISKIETGEINIDISSCTLKSLLDVIESREGEKARKKGLEFQINCCDGLPETIHTDPDKLLKSLLNLVDNAIKFTDRGHVYTNVSLEGSSDQTFIRFDIEDTGPGITDDLQENIFEAFTQGDSSLTRRFGGTGLGLSITRKLVDLLGGKLVLSSKPDAGSVFSILIPLGLVSDHQEMPVNEEKAKDSGCVSKGKVLLVEDSPITQKLLLMVLTGYGIEMVLATDGSQGVIKAQENSYDLILMDIQMPVMDGYQATKIIRGMKITTPIVALTAHALKGDKEKCLTAGCDDYISKPIDKEVFKSILEQYLPEFSTRLHNQTPPTQSKELLQPKS